MGQMKTPGVYVVEKSAFPNSVVEVATAVPAFIGYTEKASNKGKSLKKVPWRISSLSEFHSYFGFGPTPKFNIVDSTTDAAAAPAFSSGGKDYWLEQTPGSRFLLYLSMVLFFQNGGGPCYIVSVGSYDDQDGITSQALIDGIHLLIKEQEPTMVVIPETVLLPKQEAITVQQAALLHCGEKMKNRIAILDIWDGFRDRQDPAGDCIDDFRSALGINNLDYAAAYYPWVRTTIVSDKELSFENLDSPDQLQALIKQELRLPDTAPEPAEGDTPAEKSAKLKIAAQLDAVGAITTLSTSGGTPAGGTAEGGGTRASWDMSTLDKTLRTLSTVYGDALTEMQAQLNLLPPAAAMAGVYTTVDNARGVWKAPANVSLNSVVAPAVSVSHDEQEDLNVTTQGKSINAIRTFIGEGVLVWGARTLDGNSLDWRYINVRRTMIMLEESIKLATKAYVFDPNVSSTWVTIRSMIGNFLYGIWKQGGLAGAVPEDAYSVHVGLGETMTPQDILEGILRVTVLVAITRPAEFIEITFQQQMQKS
jgi:phage tail sheath protein FI